MLLALSPSKRDCEVGHHRLADDLDRLARQPVLVDELLAGEDRRARAVRGRRALQLGQRLVDHRATSRISSSVYSSWNCAYGLFTECWWFLYADLRELLGVVP